MNTGLKSLSPDLLPGFLSVRSRLCSLCEFVDRPVVLRDSDINRSLRRRGDACPGRGVVGSGGEKLLALQNCAGAAKSTAQGGKAPRPGTSTKKL